MSQIGIRRNRVAGLFLVAAIAVGGAAQEVRPGVWAGADLSSVPLPVAGYDVYMLGELHGVKENVDLFLQYAAKLYEAAGLREVALEEKPAYESDAQLYVDGKSSKLPPMLCLRSEVLDAIRRFNAGRDPGRRLIVRLVDIDINPESIHTHLLRIRQSIPAAVRVVLPEVHELKDHGLQAVDALEGLTSDAGLRSQLRTIRYSIRALQQGLSAGAGRSEGSPYLDDREDAITENIRDLVRNSPGRPVLALYGIDHVSKNLLHNGGPKRDQDFEPAALRLGRAGVKVHSLIAVPLAGRWSWRGREGELLWSAADASLSTGERLDLLLSNYPAIRLFYVDPKREPARLPTSDLARSRADGFLFITRGTPAGDACPVR